jgi:hypothetical protein
LLDRTLYESAVEVASDRSAGVAARVQAFRILLSQVDPTSPPTYEELAEGRLSSLVFDWGPAYGEPLPSDFRVRIFAAASEVASQRPPAQVKEAAEVVKTAARLALRGKAR